MKRLLQVGSMSQAMGVYVSASVAGKAVGFGRTLAFAYLLAHAPQQYNVWAIGSMLFGWASSALCLGANHGLARYVSVYQARGELWAFYRRVAPFLLILPVVLVLPALLAAWPLAAALVAQPAQGVQPIDIHIVQLSLANGVLLALFVEMTGLMYGLRTYRLSAVVELVFAVLFTVVAMVWLKLTGSGLDLLWAHLACLGVMLASGLMLVHRAVRLHAGDGEGSGEGVSPAVEAPSSSRPVASALGSHERPEGITSASVPAPMEHALRGLLFFGMPALGGQLAWQAAPFVSYYLVNRYLGAESAGVFALWMLLAQIVSFAANAAWQVLYSHVARRHADNPGDAMAQLQTSYKLLALLALAASVAIYVSRPIWSLVLPVGFRSGQDLLGGLLMLYAAMTQLAILTIAARLKDQPLVTGLAALAGGAVSAALAMWWLPTHGAIGAAWAAGIGMLTGGSAVAIAWFALGRVRLNLGTWVVLLSPAILLAGPVGSGVLALGLMAAATLTTLVFSHEEKVAVWQRIRGCHG